MPKITASDTLDLSIPERIQLVGDIWDTIAQKEDTVSLTEYEKQIIDERLEKYHKKPSAGSSWNDVKGRIIGHK
ncbi:MAG TPA: addiction module protein [Spirochaetota bacterium]|nr:addiction module protein [Spirochaetota bacterium]HQP49541.1 addiction module protein [Spirochaetota bacterium]